MGVQSIVLIWLRPSQDISAPLCDNNSSKSYKRMPNWQTERRNSSETRKHPLDEKEDRKKSRKTRNGDSKGSKTLIIKVRVKGIKIGIYDRIKTEQFRGLGLGALERVALSLPPEQGPLEVLRQL